MGSSTIRHPIIVDSDALISVANTSLWPCILDNLRITTTNVCIGELRRHVRDKSEYAPEGTRERWVHDGSQVALEPFNDETNDDFVYVPSVPRPSGRDAGETSVKQEVEQNPGTHTYAVMMDKNGRDFTNRVYSEHDAEGVAVAPSYLLYLLYDGEYCSKEEFCRACGEMLRGEDWASYEAIQAIWEEIPVDCSEYVGGDLLA